MAERVTWTALPNHSSDEGLLKLSIFVSPRLTNDDGSSDARKLGEFEAFSNWPKTLTGATFSVAFDGLANPIEGLVPTTKPDAALWGRIFPPETTVQPFAFQDHGVKNLHIFPVRPVLQFLRDVYGSLAATTPPELPGLDDPGTPIRRIADLGDLPSRASRLPSFRAERKHKEPPPKDNFAPLGQVVVDHHPSADVETFQQAYRFYYRPGSRRFPDTHEELYPVAPTPEFHQIVAQLGDQPELLRRLGLVIDLEFPNPGIGADGVVKAHPTKHLVDGPTPPGTAFEHGGQFFGAKPRHPIRFHRGLLRLSAEFYDLYQIDVDGAATKTADFAATIGRLRNPDRRSHATPVEAGTPVLRSAGLSIAANRRGEQLLQDLDVNRTKNKGLEDGDDIVFDLEDVVRGYRLDVIDESAVERQWLSLHHRHCIHTVDDPSGKEPPIVVDEHDEGYVKGVAATAERVDHSNASDDLYLHEAIFGWEGWSLSAPRPGKRIVEPGQGDDGGTVSRFDPQEKNPLAITTVTEVERGTLPRLRFGHAYRVRARAVDLAGNSLPFTMEELSAPEDHAVLGPDSYLRFDPVPAAAVLRRRPDTEGESLEHLVVRSSLGTTAIDYANDPAVKEALEQAGAQHAYFEDSQRHLAAPKGSVQLAELLGRLDAGFGASPAEATAALRVALREEGTFLDQRIVDLSTGQKTIAQLGLTLFPPGASFPLHRGDGLQSGTYVLFMGDTVLLPYLPDPFAIGVALTAFDRAGNEAFHTTGVFDGTWPELQPFRLRLSEGPLGATLDNGVLNVALPQGEEITVRLSSIFDPAELETFGLWNWATTKAADLRTAAEQGRHWMLTPYRNLTLTHAVQLPLQVPDSTDLEPTRELGDTYAGFGGPIHVDAKSTGRLDVLADWTEDVDLLTDDAPRMQSLGTAVHKKAVAFSYDLDPAEDSAQATIRRHVQAGWRCCRKCEGLAFGEGFAGSCPAGGSHDLTASGNYALSHNDPSPVGESGWRWCAKCQGLYFPGQGSGTCPGGGVHINAGSGHYVLVDDASAQGQHGWCRCLNCGGLVFGSDLPGPCPAGGPHDPAGLKAYTLELVVTQPQDRVSRHEFGDTKYRRATYHAVATTRYREFFPRTITDHSEKITLTESVTNEDGTPRSELVRDIPSSARPAAPGVVYVVPTFEWERHDDGDQRRHVRRGNGVRVYLRRPWFSSGDGELLGVVLRDPVWRRVPRAPLARESARAPAREGARGSRGPGPLGAEITPLPAVRFPFRPRPLGDPLASFVTDWGSDPVWQSADPRGQPTAAGFPRRVATANGLTLAELSETFTVTVAAHEVSYDTERRLWYSDIDVALGETYFPFVRLALARYQPNSLLGAHLSRVVMTDFMQLLPDRTANLSLSAGNALITVSGLGARNIVDQIRESRFAELPATPRPGTVIWVSLQRRDPYLGGDLAWRTVADPIQLSIESLDRLATTWTGSLRLPRLANDGEHRLLITETEIYLRDEIDGDPSFESSPLDRTRSRLVYADDFELPAR
jgi:hypothetical protein